MDALGSLERTWSGLRRFDAVIPTGGGAVVLGERLLLRFAQDMARRWQPRARRSTGRRR